MILSLESSIFAFKWIMILFLFNFFSGSLFFLYMVDFEWVKVCENDELVNVCDGWCFMFLFWFFLIGLLFHFFFLTLPKVLYLFSKYESKMQKLYGIDSRGWLVVEKCFREIKWNWIILKV